MGCESKKEISEKREGKAPGALEQFLTRKQKTGVLVLMNVTNGNTD